MLQETLSHINYLAVLVGFIIASGLGMLWYSKFMFMKQWEVLINRMEKSDQTIGIICSMIVNLAWSFGIAVAFKYFEVSTVWTGLKFGLFLALFFSVSVIFLNNTFQGKSWKLSAIDAGYVTTSLLIISAIVSAWK